MIKANHNDVTLAIEAGDEQLICEAAAVLAAALDHLVKQGEMSAVIPQADRMMYLETIISIANINYLGDHTSMMMKIPNGANIEDFINDNDESEEEGCYDEEEEDGD